MIEAMRYESFKAGEIIMNWGDLGDKFYIIIKGSVKVLVPDPKVKDAKDKMEIRYQELTELREDRRDIQRLIDIKERIKKEMDFNNL
jgi:hypothetical protein